MLHAVASLPGVPPILRAIYRWIARNRACDGAACNLPRANARRSTAWLDALPLLALTTAALAFGHRLPAWAWMWMICFALFFGCKWLVFRAALRRGEKPGFARAIGFLFGWVGMDAKAFFNRKAVTPNPRTAEWLFTIAKMLIGAVVVWGGARRIFAINPLLAGWIAMVGLMPLLHFGFFELLALAWRKAGVAVTPLMLAPIKAHSLADFWGRRWNTGFHQLTEKYVFNPTRRRIGPRAALLVAFFLSGLLHDLVISVPARGGYGLPTIYFLIQGAGVLFERTHFARWWGMGRGWRGWLFTMIVTAGPAFWLFHPPFVRNVMIPFLQTLHAF
jgi:alginate O-acetyltransferase complex protein AlgI